MWIAASLLLSAHLLCLNVASAGPLVSALWDGLARRGRLPAENSAAWLAGLSWRLALVGAALGLLLGGLRYNAAYGSVLQSFANRLVWGGAEFLFSVALIAWQARWLERRPIVGTGGWIGRTVLAILAATNLLYHFPPLFTLIAQSAAGQLEPGTVTSARFRELVAEPEVLAWMAHFTLASLAVAGAAILFRAVYPCGAGPQASEIRWGAGIALAATALQFPVGLWLATVLPSRSQMRLMGGDLLATGFFLAALGLAFSLLHQTAAVALGDTSPRAVKRPLLPLLLVIVTMVAALQRLRLA